MKKMLFLLVVLFVATSGFAQIKFGVKAGTNFSKISGDYFNECRSRTGMVFGIFVQNGFTKKLYFQPEIVFSMQGAIDSGDDYYIIYKMNYINIPLLVKYYVMDGLSVNVGPQIGMLASGRMVNNDGNDNITDFCHSYEVGMDFGVAYEIKQGLSFDMRYNLGLLQMMKEEEFGIDNSKNGVLQITLGYTFEM